MPYIQITATEGTLNKDEQDSFVTKVSNAVLRSEGADPNDPAAQSLVWAYYSQLPKGNVYVGGENQEKAPLRIAVTTPEGALTVEARASLAKDIGVIVDEFVGPYEGRLNHWTMLTELDEGSWASGQIFPLKGIQAAMNIKTAAV